MDISYVARERVFSEESYGVKFVDFLCILGGILLDITFWAQKSADRKTEIFYIPNNEKDSPEILDSTMTGRV